MTGWLASALEQVAGTRVAVFGDFAVDAYWVLDQDESELSVETGKPVRKVRSQAYSLGGAGNIVANLVALGVGEVRALGMCGDDLFGDLLRRRLADLAVDATAMVRNQADWQTPVFAKPLRLGVELERLDFGAHNELSQPSFDQLQVGIEAAAADCDLVILNQQIPIGVAPSPVIAWLNQLIRSHPVGRFLVDSRHRPHAFDGAVLKCNESEARAMQEDPSSPPEELARQLAERVTAPAFVTAGAAGIVAADSRGTWSVPGLSIPEPTDPCGAGDTVTAALAAGLAVGLDPETGARLANLAAAVTVAKVHTTGTATPAEILALARNQAS